MYFKETPMQPPLKRRNRALRAFQKLSISFSNHSSPWRNSTPRPRDYYNPDFMVIIALLFFKVSLNCAFLKDIVLPIFESYCLC